MKTVKVTGHPRLYRRGGRYYHRAAIPQDIRDTYPKSEETFSLKTTDYQEALRRVRKAASEVDERFDQHRRKVAAKAKPQDSLSDDLIVHLTSLYRFQILESDEEMRTERLATNIQDPYVHMEVMGELIQEARASYAAGKVARHVHRAVADILDEEGIFLAPDSPAWQRLGRAFQETFIAAAGEASRRDEGEVVVTPRVISKSSQPPLPSHADTSHGQGPLLSVAAEEWLSEKSRTWTKKTANDHRATIASFITIAGDKPLDAYGKADGRAFKAVLLRLPANWTKQKALQGLSIDKAADKAHELGMPPMADKNVNKLIGYAAAFWNWAADHYDDCPANPLNNFKIKLKKRARDERDPFTLPELQAIFRAPVFTGCKSLRHWRQPGNLVPRDSGMFWVPLVSLLSGARMGEVLQLYVNDVKNEGSIVYLDINGDGEDKSLKTASSWRSIPIHPELERLGFLEHVQQMRQRGSLRLFPDMPMGEDGYYSSVYSKRFRQLLDGLGIKHSKNAFHSFRHSFEDACRASGISRDVMNALQGHAESGMSGRYGSGYHLATLAEAIERLEYRGLDLSHLYPRP